MHVRLIAYSTCTSVGASHAVPVDSVAVVQSKDRGPPDRTNFGPDQTAQSGLQKIMDQTIDGHQTAT